MLMCAKQVYAPGKMKEGPNFCSIPRVSVRPYISVLSLGRSWNRQAEQA